MDALSLGAILATFGVLLSVSPGKWQGGWAPGRVSLTPAVVERLPDNPCAMYVVAHELGHQADYVAGRRYSEVGANRWAARNFARVARALGARRPNTIWERCFL